MRNVLPVLTVSALLIMAIAGPVAANSEARPFKGSASGEVTFRMVGTDVCPASDVFAGGMQSTSFATGTASHLGAVTTMARHCTPAADTIAGGQGTFVAANGDEIYFDYNGSAPFPGEGTTVIVATTVFEITGGTGRFADATGSGELIGYVTFEGFGVPEWPASWVWNGTIAY